MKDTTLTKEQRSWLAETGHDQNGSRKYRTAHGADSTKRPAPHTREKCWIPPHKRKDGSEVKGHWRMLK